MKGLIILANGFEDTEAITTIDILRRAKLDLDLVGIEDIDIITQSNIQVKAEKKYSEIELSDYEYVIIPGGKAVFNVLDKKNNVEEIINYFYKTNKLIAAICAAPLLIGKLGILRNQEFTCFPGCEDRVIDGIYLQNKGVVVRENIITAKSMAYTIPFALEIITKLLGEEESLKVKKAIFA